jgi:hypothetical protein
MEHIISRLLALFKSEGSTHLKEVWQTVDGFLVKFFYLILFICITIASFVLGRITKFLENRTEFVLESKEAFDQKVMMEKEKLFTNTREVSTGTIVASKNGSKYYFLWCKGASNIKEANKKTFHNEEEAQKAGYVLANNCH